MYNHYLNSKRLSNDVVVFPYSFFAVVNFALLEYQRAHVHNALHRKNNMSSGEPAEIAVLPVRLRITIRHT